MIMSGFECYSLIHSGSAPRPQVTPLTDLLEAPIWNLGNVKRCHIDFFFPCTGTAFTGGMVLCLVGKKLRCFWLLLQGDAEESLTSPAYDLPQRVRKKRFFYLIHAVLGIGDILVRIRILIIFVPIDLL